MYFLRHDDWMLEEQVRPYIGQSDCNHHLYIDRRISWMCILYYIKSSTLIYMHPKFYLNVLMQRNECANDRRRVNELA